MDCLIRSRRAPILFLTALSACGQNFHLQDNPVLNSATPTISFDASGVVNAANAADFNLSGTCSADGVGNVVIRVGSLPDFSTDCTAGLWQLTNVNLSSLADGLVSVDAEITDARGQRGAAVASLNKDTAAPTVSIVAGAVSQANQTNYALSGTCSENGTGVLQITLATLSPIAADCLAGVWSLTALDVSAIADGTGLVATIQGQDAAGNTATSTDTFDKDTSAPTASIVAGDVSLANQSSYGVSGTCSDDGTNNVIVTLATLTAITTNCTSGAWSLSGIDISGVADSAALLASVRHVDSFGNEVTVSDSFVKDTVNPTVTIVANDINIANETNYSVSGVCSDDGVNNLSVTIATLSPVLASCSSGTWSVSGVDASAVSDGAAKVASVQIQDGVGNIASATDNFAKDTAAPTVSISTPLPIINAVNQGSYSLGGSCSENTRNVLVSISTLDFVATCSALSWSLTGLDLSSVANGSVNVTVTHSDAVLNSATASTTATKDDTPAPLAPQVTISNPATQVGYINTPTVEVTPQSGESFNLNFEINIYPSNDCTGIAVSGSPAAPASGAVANLVLQAGDVVAYPTNNVYSARIFDPATGLSSACSASLGAAGIANYTYLVNYLGSFFGPAENPVGSGAYLGRTLAAPTDSFDDHLILSLGNNVTEDFGTQTLGTTSAITNTLGGITYTINHRDDNGTLSGTLRNMSITSPVSQDSATGLGNGVETTGGSSVNRNMFVFTFSQDIAHFGLEALDLESSASFTLATLRLYDSSNALIQSIDVDLPTNGSQKVHFVGFIRSQADVRIVTLSVGDDSAGSGNSEQMAIDELTFGTAPGQP